MSRNPFSDEWAKTCREMPEKCRELYSCKQGSDIWFGAAHLALALKDVIENINDKKLNNTKFISDILDFLLKSKSDMLTFIMNYQELNFKLYAVKDKKGNVKAWKPCKLRYGDRRTPESVGTEYISEEEHKWRDTARILMDALENAATTISTINGKPKNDVLNQLIGGKINETI